MPVMPEAQEDDCHVSLHAWVDESMRLPPKASGRGLYLLAAVVASEVDADPIRDSMRRLRDRSQSKLHWVAESAPRRRRIAKSLLDAPLEAVVVVGTPLDGKKQERARVQCLTELLMELERCGVSRVTLEQRTPSLNRRDEKTRARLIGAGVLTDSLRLQIEPPSQEPMLWVSDAVAGAVGAAHVGQMESYEILRSKITERLITLR